MYYLYFVRLSTYPFSLFSPPPTAPANADLALHTKLFPTILRHECISITMGNTYQIVFISLIHFIFSYLPIRRFDRQEKPFLTGPTPSCLGNFRIGGRRKVLTLCSIQRRSMRIMIPKSPWIISLLALKCIPIISGRLSLCAAQMISVERGAE